MNWLAWAIIGGVIAALFLVKKLAFVSAATARAWLTKGAKVIDVRSQEEFRQNHLPGAINIPLDQLRDQITRHAPNKQQAILLHCLSGGRSGIAKGLLKKMGYVNAFNLGSLSRARKIAGQRR